MKKLIFHSSINYKGTCLEQLYLVDDVEICVNGER